MRKFCTPYSKRDIILPPLQTCYVFQKQSKKREHGFTNNY